MRCFRCGSKYFNDDNTCLDCRADNTGEARQKSSQTFGAIVGLVMGGVSGIAPDIVIVTACLGAGLGAIVGRVYGTVRKNNYKRSVGQMAAPSKETSLEDEPVRDYAALTRYQEESLLSSGDYQRCFHCSQIIKTEANICRFCRGDVRLVQKANR